MNNIFKTISIACIALLTISCEQSDHDRVINNFVFGPTGESPTDQVEFPLYMNFSFADQAIPVPKNSIAGVWIDFIDEYNIKHLNVWYISKKGYWMTNESIGLPSPSNAAIVTAVIPYCADEKDSIVRSVSTIQTESSIANEQFWIARHYAYYSANEVRQIYLYPKCSVVSVTLKRGLSVSDQEWNSVFKSVEIIANKTLVFFPFSGLSIPSNRTNIQMAKVGDQFQALIPDQYFAANSNVFKVIIGANSFNVFFDRGVLESELKNIDIFYNNDCITYTSDGDINGFIEKPIV